MRRMILHEVFLILLFITVYLSGRCTVYYVNDNSTVGDVYCTAVGNGSNDGLSPSTPKALLSQIITSYVLTANDIVYIDKGTYTDAITFTSSDQGSTSGYLKIIGAGYTNTIINNNIAANTLYFNDADYISIEGISFNMTTAGGYNTTVYIEKSSINNIIKHYCPI